MPGGRLRLFVALELPEAVRSVLSAWAAGLIASTDGLRAVPDESLHATLCFLGSTEPDRLEAVKQACESVRGRPARELSLGGGLWLPRRRPRVLAVSLADPRGEVAALQAELSRALVAAGAYEPETRPFLAHVTVARVRRGFKAPRGELAVAEAGGFDAAEVRLYRSHLGSGPARYESLHRVPLSRG